MRGRPVTEEEIARFVEDAARQHLGGLAGIQGYRFQDLVTVAFLLQYGAENAGDDPQFKQEAAESATDDLHIIWGEDVFRRHFQIKSDASLSWEHPLRVKFSQERVAFPRAELNLILHTERIANSMRWNRHANEMGDVNVDWVDIRWTMCPHLNPDFCRWLDQLSLMPSHPARYLEMWNHIFSIWINVFGGGIGHLKEVFRQVSAASSYTITSLVSTSHEMNVIVDELRHNVEGLHFAADGETLVVTWKMGRGLVPLPVEWCAIDSEFWQHYPRDPWEFWKKIGGFKSESEFD
ncbi:hypothetical protein [Rhizobium leguminosarum]|uniref:hypothetical protein n=1 Tax=Rhizobium leguminosarum TaxID=384 RepID=UPI00103F7B33|nr:hypothetical protein [Rhizobium leguminosarum]TBZ80590.1 hypothetical protein E0H53_29700 [Rhizobium leguminosarum bv. viciae]TBZ99501.1 hypothetical protein E0H63_25305 [Rhizobium leguminosarum bv. viciae]